jgi:hypothetical protein
VPGLPHLPPPLGPCVCRYTPCKLLLICLCYSGKSLKSVRPFSALTRSFRATGSEGVLFGRLKQKINFRIFIFVRPVYLCCPKLDTFTMSSRLCPLTYIDFVKHVSCFRSFHIMLREATTSESQFNPIKLSGYYMYHLL